MNEELKPCPWCGDTECNPASMEMGKDAGKYSYMAEVQCGCGGIGPEAYGECASDAEANAVKTWNARLTPAVKDSLTAAAAAGVDVPAVMTEIERFGRAYCSYARGGNSKDMDEATRIYDGIHALLAAPAVPVGDGRIEPDMFWSAENPEDGGLTVSEIAETLSDNLMPGESGEYEIMCAKKLPNRTLRVMVQADHSDYDYEWLPAKPAPDQEKT